MNKMISNVLMKIQHIEQRPLMYSSSADFFSLSNLIVGYFMGIDQCLQLDLNTQFTKWVNKNSIKTSLAWQGHILHILAKDDEVEASKILFLELKLFLTDLQGQSGQIPN